MAEMIALVAAWFPDRQFILVVDSLYSGKSVLATLPSNFDLIGPVHAHCRPLRTSLTTGLQRSRIADPRKAIGSRASQAWEKDPLDVARSCTLTNTDLHGSLRVKTRTGLYYKAGKDRLLRLVLSQDTVGDRPTRIFYSTNVNLQPRKILSLFSLRWSIEVTHFDCKQHLGLEDPANRVPQGSPANGTDVDVSLQPDRGVVRHRRPCRFPNSRSSVVPVEV